MCFFDNMNKGLDNLKQEIRKYVIFNKVSEKNTSKKFLFFLNRSFFMKQI